MMDAGAAVDVAVDVDWVAVSGGCGVVVVVVVVDGLADDDWFAAPVTVSLRVSEEATH